MDLNTPHLMLFYFVFIVSQKGRQTRIQFRKVIIKLIFIISHYFAPFLEITLYFIYNAYFWLIFIYKNEKEILKSFGIYSMGSQYC